MMNVVKFILNLIIFIYTQWLANHFGKAGGIMDCEVKFGTIPFWGRFCSACIMLLGGSVTFPSVRLNVNGKPFQPTLKAESPNHSLQQLKAEIRAMCIELECTTHEKFDLGMYHALRGRLRELSAV